MRAVLEAHEERAPFSFAPIRHQKAQRRAAMREAGALERRPLKNSGHHEQPTAEQRARAHHHR